MQTPFGKETYLYWYEIMLLLRRFEEKAGQLYGMQKIRGFCHLYIGQEAIAAGAMTAMRDDDNMITAYRDHALAIAKGITAKECMAELYGKATGCTKGKGGSMHFFSKEKRFFGGHGIVGGQIGLGAGIAFAEVLTELLSACLETALQGRGCCTKHSIWLCYGNYRSCLFARIIFTQWAHR